MGCAGNSVVHRIGAMKKAGFEQFPKDLAGFLKLAQAYKANGLPPGFALGNATGDGNVWCHWLVWSHGGRMVDPKGNVVISSPETEAALNYGKQLYETFISWLDPNNNKAFLDGQIGMTTNGISVYYAAKNSQDPKVKAMADDIGHANLPVGPVGKPTELNLFFPMMLFRYLKVPNAAKAYLAFMMEKEQVRAVAAGRDRVRVAPVEGLREQSAVEIGPEDHPVPRLDEDHAAQRLLRTDGLCLGGVHGRLHHGQHGGGGGLGLEDAEGGDGPREGARRALLQGVDARV